MYFIFPNNYLTVFRLHKCSYVIHFVPKILKSKYNYHYHHFHHKKLLNTGGNFPFKKTKKAKNDIILLLDIVMMLQQFSKLAAGPKVSIRNSNSLLHVKKKIKK